jgi:hypothetical protein
LEKNSLETTFLETAFLVTAFLGKKILVVSPRLEKIQKFGLVLGRFFRKRGVEFLGSL